MLRRRGRKSAGIALVSAGLMAFSAILHPKEQNIETVRDETRRKKDALSGEPFDTDEGHDSLTGGGA